MMWKLAIYVLPLVASIASNSSNLRNGSSGCGRVPLVAPGAQPSLVAVRSRDPSSGGGVVERWYYLAVPAAYDAAVPAALVISFHGFYDDAADEIREDGLLKYIEQNGLNVIVAYPSGSGGAREGGDSYAWNIEGNGLNTQPGPLGLICATPRTSDDAYACYHSCSRSAAGCDARWGCNSASCMDDRTFVRTMLDVIESELCVDLDAVHLTGISAGGMMTYQTALDLHDRVASIAPVAGSRFFGYSASPASPVAVLDTHGFADSVIPANQSNGVAARGPADATVSEDMFYYTPVPTLLKAFAQSNHCAGGNVPYETPWDGVRGLTCNRPHGHCAASVVQCVGEWGHTWLLHEEHPLAYAQIILSFFQAHRRVPLDAR